MGNARCGTGTEAEASSGVDAFGGVDEDGSIAPAVLALALAEPSFLPLLFTRRGDERLTGNGPEPLSRRFFVRRWDALLWPLLSPRSPPLSLLLRFRPGLARPPPPPPPPAARDDEERW